MLNDLVVFTNKHRRRIRSAHIPLGTVVKIVVIDYEDPLQPYLVTWNGTSMPSIEGRWVYESEVDYVTVEIIK